MRNHTRFERNDMCSLDFPDSHMSVFIVAYLYDIAHVCYRNRFAKTFNLTSLYFTSRS